MGIIYVAVTDGYSWGKSDDPYESLLRAFRHAQYSVNQFIIYEVKELYSTDAELLEVTFVDDEAQILTKEGAEANRYRKSEKAKKAYQNYLNLIEKLETMQ